jgi:hypothetical protein
VFRHKIRSGDKLINLSTGGIGEQKLLRINGLKSVKDHLYWQALELPGVDRDKVILAVPKVSPDALREIVYKDGPAWIVPPEGDAYEEWEFNVDEIDLAQDFSLGSPDWFRGKARVAPDTFSFAYFEITSENIH